MGRSTQVKSFMVKPSILTENRTLTHSDSGKTYFLDAAAGLTVTLPSPRGGVNFRFIVKTAPTSGNYTISTSSDIIAGQITTSDLSGAGGKPSVQLPGVQYVKLMANLAVVADCVEMVSDGTYWYTNGFSSKWDAIRFIEESASPSASPSISLSRSPSASPSASPSVSTSISPSEST